MTLGVTMTLGVAWQVMTLGVVRHDARRHDDARRHAASHDARRRTS